MTWEEGEAPRKLMLVLDEAHLYQGAMGTEVSMLINRLRSVLSEGDKNPEIQVIITSASLGQNEEKKKEFVADLTGINPENVAVPEPARTDLLGGRDWKDLELCSEPALNHLSLCDASADSMTKDEYLFLESLNTSSKISKRLEQHYQTQGHLYERMELRHEILNDSDLFVRLYTALQHPKHLPEQLHQFRPHGEKVAPWNLQNLSMVVFGQPDENLISRLLDIVAGSRMNKSDEKEGTPLMPIRGSHLLKRNAETLSLSTMLIVSHA